MKGKFEDCTAIFTLGLSEIDVEIEDAKVSKIELIPQVGGMTQLDLTVQCTPSMDDIALILPHMKHGVEVELVLGARVLATH